MISTNFSLAGFNWRTLLANNKENVKLIVSGLIGILLTQGWLEAGMAMFVAKLILDSIDFWASKVKY